MLLDYGVCIYKLKYPKLKELNCKIKKGSWKLLSHQACELISAFG
ncbi:hypothetical protein KIS1582_0778 [Cytobacillus firmus]|uniref:Uncharacterized protein n=1 Tax=Cytobacillus firmus TaxID=1399 RepID=A0A800NEW6_CYTFI|nr:hypothetical protein KIS1582_0778 [Cytobacillus firmus]